MTIKKKLIGVMLTLIMVFSFAVPALAGSYTIITRLAGVDRYATAAEIAKEGWGQADYAVLAYGENFPDALSAGVLAQKYNAPILLTKSNDLPDVTKQTLINLQVKQVFIIGGTVVIPESIETQLQGMGIVTMRIAGYDRYDTAVKIAQQLNMPSELIVTTGEDYPDALSVAPIAASKEIPIILVPKDNLPDVVKNYIATLNVSKTYIMGDSGIISDSVFNQLMNPERIVGANKYERNIAINQKFASDFNTDSICLATGEGFADALTGALYASKVKAPLILVNNSSLAAAKTYYKNRYANANKIYVFGGTAVVPNNLIESLSGNGLGESSSVTNPANNTTDPGSLYTEDGSGAYLGYKRLMGYSGSDRFAVYFTGTFANYHVSVVDLRGLNDNDLVYWQYNGTTVTNTRKECNHFFSDLSYLKGQYGLSDQMMSGEWLQSTFGQIYLDWAELSGFAADAERMVGKYLEAAEGIDYNRGVTLTPDYQIPENRWVTGYTFEKIPVDERILSKLGIVGREKSSLAEHYEVYGFPEVFTDQSHFVDEMTDEFMAAENAIGIFNGIRMKKENGVLWFSYKDLKEKGIED